MSSKNLRKVVTPKKTKFVKGILIPLSILIIVGLFFFRRQTISYPLKELPTSSIPQPDTANEDNLQPLPDFSKYPIIPRHQFDTSTWVTYENKTIGFKFRHPPEWRRVDDYEEYVWKSQLSQDGLIKYTSDADCDCTSFPAYEFKISFSLDSQSRTKKMFYIFGQSENYRAGRDFWPAADFRGFDPEKSCDIARNELFTHLLCRVTNGVKDELYRYSVMGGFHGYFRLREYNFKNKPIDGLAFGGDGDLLRLNESYAFDGNDTDILKKIDQAVIERRLPKDIMYTYDLFEKVYETIEVE